jgi:hypothetical protein
MQAPSPKLQAPGKLQTPSSMETDQSVSIDGGGLGIASSGVAGPLAFGGDKFRAPRKASVRHGHGFGAWSLAILWSLVLGAWIFSPQNLLAADKNGVSPNAISLPSGPGSIEGLGESFEPALNNGTARYGVSIELPPGPAGHAPALRISYDGGQGNGPLGFGWNLAVPFIQRQTDKGIPRYVDGANGKDDDRDGQVDEVDELDLFINDANEELVPVASGDYFCENEQSFIRYRRVGEHWEGTLPDGTSG